MKEIYWVTKKQLREIVRLSDDSMRNEIRSKIKKSQFIGMIGQDDRVIILDKRFIKEK